jgi:superkiller protein 3
LKINPDNAEAHDGLGYALADQGKMDEAIAHYAKTLRVMPDFAGAPNNLAIHLANQNRCQEAIFHF